MDREIRDLERRRAAGEDVGAALMRRVSRCGAGITTGDPQGPRTLLEEMHAILADAEHMAAAAHDEVGVTFSGYLDEALLWARGAIRAYEAGRYADADRESTLAVYEAVDSGEIDLAECLASLNWTACRGVRSRWHLADFEDAEADWDAWECLFARRLDPGRRRYWHTDHIGHDDRWTYEGEDALTDEERNPSLGGGR